MPSYILSYDVTTAGNIHQQLVAFVKANRSVTQWSHPYIGLYLLKSNQDLQTLARSFNEFFDGKTLHLITAITGEQSQGSLPPYVWEWLNQPEPVGLGSLLSQYFLSPPDQ